MRDNAPEYSGPYKHIYYAPCKSRPYSESKIGHDDYIHTEVWRRLRDERLKIDNYQCQVCHSGINVEVHHIHYPGIWGMENVYLDLVTLCEKHHNKVHEFDNANKETMQ